MMADKKSNSDQLGGAKEHSRPSPGVMKKPGVTKVVPDTAPERVTVDSEKVVADSEKVVADKKDLLKRDGDVPYFN